MIAVCEPSEDRPPKQLEKFAASVPQLHGDYLERSLQLTKDVDLHPTIEKLPELQPYKSLDASRLRLVGQANWDTQKFIKGPLRLPFQEPAFLRHGLEVDLSCAPDFSGESHDECLMLMKAWEAQTLQAF